ncbi:hypothetical protein SpCBS45565_g05918 [Spizellomyces sp. 'palustris']|nr:hypothetical protein SpCBS45565_g05918 [Spizellomyces sp. 'palustris']
MDATTSLTPTLQATPQAKLSPIPRLVSSPHNDHTPEHGNAANPCPATSTSSKEQQSPDSNPVLPDHYYEPNGVPVFKPTDEQFKDFAAFMRAIDSFGKAAGIVKIIPPQEWSERLPDISPALTEVKIRKPIVQEITGGGLPMGTYFQMNIEQRKTYTVQDWYELSSSAGHKTPQFNSDGKPQVNPHRPAPRKRIRKVVQSEGSVEPASSVEARDKQTAATETTMSEARAVFSEPMAGSANAAQTEGQETLLGIRADESSANVVNSMLTPAPAPEIPLTLSTDVPDPTITMTQPKPTARKRPVDTPSSIHFSTKEVSEGFTDEYCKELERYYWRNITYVAPLYGADMLGSLFDHPLGEGNSWNLARLDNLLRRVNVFLPGVNSPYLYFGMWKATFAWHVEDMDLYSINYIHFGAPKQWYVIPPSHRGRFETVARGVFSEEAHKCPEFLRHKTCVLSPKFLTARNVPVHRVVQKAGEFVITFPYGYHQGYNLGFNCAESVNFALDSWVEIGKKAGYCECIGDSVKLDVAGLFDPPRLPVRIKLKLPSIKSPDGTMVEQRVEKVEDIETMEKVEKMEKKRKNTEVDMLGAREKPKGEMMNVEKKPKKRKKDKEGTEGKANADSKVTGGDRKKSVSEPKIKCVLCTFRDGDFLPTEAEGRWAHRQCALFVPETWIDPHPVDPEKEIVKGIDAIDKARWRLKCAVCKPATSRPGKMGACIQCAKGKCVRAYHVSCAYAAGLTLMQEGDNWVCYCAQHDPIKQTEKRLEREKLVEEAPGIFSVGVGVEAKVDTGWHFGWVREIFCEKQSCRVVFEDGYSRTVHWTLMKLPGSVNNEREPTPPAQGQPPSPPDG